MRINNNIFNLSKIQQVNKYGGIIINDEFVSTDKLGICDLCSDYYSIFELIWNTSGNQLLCRKCKN